METIFTNTKKCKSNETNKFVLNLSQRLNLRRSDKHLALQKFIYLLHVENIRKQYKSNKLKIMTPAWNDEFEFPDGSYSVLDIEDYIEYIIKKHEALTTIPPIHFYSNRINNRLVFKIKDGYKLELQTLKSLKQGNYLAAQKLIYKNKKDKNYQVLSS